MTVGYDQEGDVRKLPKWARTRIELLEMPAPHGLVLCEYPLTVTDVFGKEYPVPAFAWITAVSREGDRGIAFLEFSDKSDLMEYTRRDDRLIRNFPPITLLNSNFIMFGSDIDKLQFISTSTGEVRPPEANRSQIALLRYVQSFWAFVQQRVVIPMTAEHARPVRKRAAKQQAYLPALQVIRLRRGDYRTVTPSENPRHVDWRYRWIVSGHWRMQPYPSIDDYKQIWIEAFVKGPPDRPLLKRKTVMAVER